MSNILVRYSAEHWYTKTLMTEYETEREIEDND